MCKMNSTCQFFNQTIRLFTRVMYRPPIFEVTICGLSELITTLGYSSSGRSVDQRPLALDQSELQTVQAQPVPAWAGAGAGCRGGSERGGPVYHSAEGPPGLRDREVAAGRDWVRVLVRVQVCVVVVLMLIVFAVRFHMGLLLHSGSLKTGVAFHQNKQVFSSLHTVFHSVLKQIISIT